jgi:hypothetical protein
MIKDVWDNKNSLIPPLCIEVSLPSQKSERSFICVLGELKYNYINYVHKQAHSKYYLNLNVTPILLTFRGTWVYPRFLVGSCYPIFSYMCYVLYIVACPFVLFLLAVVLSVLLRFTDSDYLFCIVKLSFFNW